MDVLKKWLASLNFLIQFLFNILNFFIKVQNIFLIKINNEILYPNKSFEILYLFQLFILKLKEKVMWRPLILKDAHFFILLYAPSTVANIGDRAFEGFQFIIRSSDEHSWQFAQQMLNIDSCDHSTIGFCHRFALLSWMHVTDQCSNSSFSHIHRWISIWMLFIIPVTTMFIGCPTIHSLIVHHWVQ